MAVAKHRVLPKQDGGREVVTKNILTAVAMVPVFKESREMIQQLWATMQEVRRELKKQGVEFRCFFLSDGAEELPDGVDCLNNRRQENWGLARTLMEGYFTITNGFGRPDLTIRMDAQEHDPRMILRIVDHFQHSPVQAVFLPVMYWVKDQPRPLMKDVTEDMNRFIRALRPIDREVVLEIYNQKFPLGFQAFTLRALRTIYPQLEEGMKLFEEKHGPPSWGLDLLAILLAANAYPTETDFIFGGWSTPWDKNITPEKRASQQDKARKMADIAIELGCISR